MQFIDVFILIFIFIACYIFFYRAYTKYALQRLKNGNSRFKNKDFYFKNFISKINFLKTKDLFLSKQGYPLKLDSIRYYLFKVSLGLLFLFAGIINYNSVFLGTFLGFLGYLFVDFYIFLNKKTRNSQICTDLYNVINSICLQLSAHVSLKDSLKYQYENCHNKDFKKSMIEFSTAYELSELNIDTATKILKDKYDILEIDMFCNALSEYNKVGDIVEILENLSTNLEEKQIDSIKDATRTKIVYITLGVIIALMNIILLIFYPLFLSLGQGFNNIFK